MIESDSNLDQLREKCFDNEDLVLKLISRFDKSLSIYEIELGQASETQNYELIHSLGHRLAGESGTMCAWKIHESAKQLCELCRSLSFDLIETLIQELTVEMQRFRANSLSREQMQFEPQ
ncbi:MAG: Hpt domain-containing protein [Planctomicrobium sp.]|jgi:HPt (histidine-containing phosphotransfer) domain-containing protein|nr:Hpt domain-containing protein [Planctomicrobium sp.]